MNLVERYSELLEEYWGTAGAGLLFVTEDQRIMLLKRSPYVNEPGTWGVAGGAINHGESPLQGAEREAREELGQLPPFQPIGTYVFKDGDFKYTTYIVEVDKDVPEWWKPQLDWETDKVGWFTLKKAMKLPLHFGAKPVLAKLKRMFK